MTDEPTVETLHLVFKPDDQDPLDRMDHEVLAVLKLSGEKIEVGYLKDTTTDTPFIRTSGDVEPIYMNCKEVSLLISALALAKFEAQGEPE